MKYYIGLDNSSTATKAALFDGRGRQLGSVGVSTAALTPRPGFVERDMDEMWRANCTVLRGVLEKTGVRAADVAGVGVCGHGKGLYLCGENGRPVRAGIISTDNRAYRYPEKWRADGTEAKAFARSCQHVMACQPVALLAWLKDHEPENYARIRWVFECKDYVRFCLTGRAMAERTDYSGANLLNLHTAAYDPALLELFGIPEMARALPPLCGSGEVCGTVTAAAAAACGLAEGTPVIGGMFDIDACALACGVTDSSLLCMIAGTWSINEYIRETPVLDGRVLMNSLYCLPGSYLVEESSATSAGTNEWFVNQLLPEVKAEAKQQGKSVYDVVDDWVSSVPPEAFVPVFLPFLMSSNVHPNAKAAFVGLSVSHTRRDMARSVFEGITFCHRQHFEKLMATRESAPRVIRLAGGAARAAVWAQMFADVMGLPVETVAASETGALGCAMAAAVAAGEYASLPDAARAMTVLSGRYEPNAALKAVYDRKYRLYQKTIACLDGLWDDMQEMIEQSGEQAGK